MGRRLRYRKEPTPPLPSAISLKSPTLPLLVNEQRDTHSCHPDVLERRIEPTKLRMDSGSHEGNPASRLVVAFSCIHYLPCVDNDSSDIVRHNLPQSKNIVYITRRPSGRNRDKQYIPREVAFFDAASSWIKRKSWYQV